MTIADNVTAVRDDIDQACARTGRRSEDVRLIAVTKNQEPAVLPALLAAGVADFGENRLEHLQMMAAAAPDGAVFHYIGRIQGRQLAKAAPLCHSIHSLGAIRHLARLGRACREQQRRMQVFIQMNTGGEAQKAGLDGDELDRALDEATTFDDVLEIVGLMAMAPDRDLPGVDDSVLRRCFADLRQLAARHHLPRLSMGMSKDYQLAIEEGATDVRIGTRLFR